MRLFEDAYQYQAAAACNADVLLTINIRDFRGVEKESIPIMTPATFVSRYTERMIAKSDRWEWRKRGVLAIFERRIAKSESFEGA